MMKYKIGDTLARNSKPLPERWVRAPATVEASFRIIGIGLSAYFIQSPRTLSILMIDSEFAETFWDKQVLGLTEFLKDTIEIARKDGSAVAVARLKQYIAEHADEDIRPQILKSDLWRELMPLVADQLIADADVTRK